MKTRLKKKRLDGLYTFIIPTQLSDWVSYWNIILNNIAFNVLYILYFYLFCHSGPIENIFDDFFFSSQPSVMPVGFSSCICFDGPVEIKGGTYPVFLVFWALNMSSWSVLLLLLLLNGLRWQNFNKENKWRKRKKKEEINK